jgi:hypothetical protein
MGDESQGHKGSVSINFVSDMSGPEIEQTGLIQIIREYWKKEASSNADRWAREGIQAPVRACRHARLDGKPFAHGLESPQSALRMHPCAALAGQTEAHQPSLSTRRSIKPCLSCLPLVLGGSLGTPPQASPRLSARITVRRPATNDTWNNRCISPLHGTRTVAHRGRGGSCLLVLGRTETQVE